MPLDLFASRKASERAGQREGDRLHAAGQKPVTRGRAERDSRRGLNLVVSVWAIEGLHVVPPGSGTIAGRGTPHPVQDKDSKSHAEELQQSCKTS